MLIPLCCLIAGIGLHLYEKRIKIKGKIFDLLDDDQEKDAAVNTKQQSIGSNIILPSTFVAVALFVQALSGRSTGTIFASGLIAGAFGIIISEQIRKRKTTSQIRSIEYFLPLIMERVVMAVEAGLDIIPAIKTVVGIEQRQLNYFKNKQIHTVEDPVSKALSLVVQRTEKGVHFEEALKDVAKLSSCASLQHSFLHLGIAYREGGELIGPLRELSDATQSQYQDSIEEDLAKLPVKATAPLVLTFAGLILFFLSSPLIQILSFAAKATPK
jgi:Flp pilus assembly protein TadB